MSDEQNNALQAWDMLGETSDVLIIALQSGDMDKSHEAISILVMQAVDIFGQDHPVFQQCFPAWDAIKTHIDSNNQERALSQAQTWKRQLEEIRTIIAGAE